MSITTSKQGNRFALFVLALALGAQFFFGPAALPLLDNNEGLYATIARDMLASGDYIVPRIEGLPYLEKPPLLYWLVGLAFALFGLEPWVARLVPELAGALTCAALYGAARLAGSARAGWLAAAILGSMVAFAGVAHAVMFDILNTLFVTAAVLCFAIHLERRDPRWLRAAYAAAALSGMTKGLLGPAVFVLILATHWARLGARPADLRRLLDPIGLAMALALFLPWHVALGLHSPGLLWRYLYDEHVLRFLDLREPHDYYTGPPWYYVPRLLTGVLPWTLLLAYPIWTLGNGDKASERVRVATTWFWVTFVFFTLSRAKANYYMVLGMPALAWLFALELDAERVDRSHWALAFGAVGAVLAALATGLTYAGVEGVWLPPRFAPEAAYLVLGLGMLASACFLSVAIFRPARPQPAVGIAALGSLFMLLCAQRAAVPLQDELSSWRMGTYVRDHIPPTTQVLMFEDFERYSAFAYYVRRRVGVLDSRSNDLAAGIRMAGDTWWFPDRSALTARVTIEPPVIVVGQDRRSDFRLRYGRAWRCAGPTLGRLTLYKTSCN